MIHFAFRFQVVVLAIVASALGVPAPEADPQVLVAGSAATLPLALNASPLLRSAVAPAVAVQTPAVVATPAVRTIATPAFPAPLLKSAPCVNAANVPVPCADVDANLAVPAVARAGLPLAAPVARPVVAAPIARTVVAAPAPIARTVVAAPAPIVRAAVPAPLARTVVAAPAPARVLTPHDCVTVGGCRLRAALEGRALLVKRDAEATSEAEADPQFLASGLPLPLAYNNLGYSNALGYNNLYSPYYNNIYNPYNYGFAAPAIAAPAVRTVATAAPVAVNAALPAIAAPVARTVVTAPAPVARTVVAAPAPIAPVVRTAVPAPLPLARAPVVAARTRPVTYTHLGAHPIQPTTVLETEPVLLH